MGFSLLTKRISSSGLCETLDHYDIKIVVLWRCDTHSVRKKRAASILRLVDGVIVSVETVTNINQTHFIEDRDIDNQYH